MAGASRDQTQAIPFATFGTGSLLPRVPDVPVSRGSPLGLDALVPIHAPTLFMVPDRRASGGLAGCFV